MNYTDMYLIVSTNNKAYDIFSFFMSNNKITKLNLEAFFIYNRFCLIFDTFQKSTLSYYMKY